MTSNQKTSLTISMRSFISFTLFLLIGVISLTTNVLETYDGITIASIAMITTILIALKSLNGEAFTFTLLFLLFSYIMHLGHPLLISLGYSTVLGYDQRCYTSEMVYMQACQYCVKIQFWLMLGMFLGAIKTFRFRRQANITTGKDAGKGYIQKEYEVGITLFVICILPRLYVDLSKVILYLQGGYLNTYNVSINGYVLVIAKMLDLAILMIIVGSRNNKARARRWMFGMCTYHLLFMMTGNRGDAVVRILVMLFVYTKLFPLKRMSLTKIIGAFCGIWVGAAMLSTLGSLRLDGMTISMYFTELIDNIFEEPAVLKIFSEFGVSIKTVCYAFETFPGTYPFSYGMNYLKGSLAFLPNIGGFITNSIKELVYVYYFPNHSVIGGSYIGEFYYAFGQNGWVLAILTGFIVSKIDYLRIRAQIERNWKMFLVSIVFISPALWWIRDYYYTCVREIIMSILLIYVLYRVHVRIGKNGNIKDKERIST